MAERAPRRRYRKLNPLKDFFVEKKPHVKDKILTVPNIITSLGIVFTVLYIFMYVAEWNTQLILAVVFLAMLSDLLDGFAARRLDQHTVLGKNMDSFRDQLLKFAIIGNIAWVVREGSVLWVIVLLATIEIYTIFLKRALKSTGKSGASHTIGKLRLLFLYIFGAAFLFKTYSGIDSLFLVNSLSTSVIVFLMMTTSFVASVLFRRAVNR